MLNRSYSHAKKPRRNKKLNRTNKSMVSYKYNSKWKPKGNYNIIKAMTNDIEVELKKIEKVKRDKLILEDRYYSTRHELMALKNRHIQYANRASSVMRVRSNDLKHSSFSKEVRKRNLNSVNHKLDSLMGVIESKRKDKMNSNKHILAKFVQLKRCKTVSGNFKKNAQKLKLRKEANMSDMLLKVGMVDSKFKDMRKEMDNMSRYFFMETVKKRKIKKMEFNVKVKFVNSYPILKDLLRKYIYNNFENEKLTEKYSAIVVGVEHMFDRLIQESGITDPMEIAMNFIKDQEQNQHLYNYLRSMKSETQDLQEETKKTKNEVTDIYNKINLEKIAEEKLLKEQSQMKLEFKIDELEAEIKNLEREKKRLLGSANEFTDYLDGKISKDYEKKILMNSQEELTNNLGNLELFSQNLVNYKNFMDRDKAKEEKDENLYLNMKNSFKVKFSPRSPSNASSKDSIITDRINNTSLRDTKQLSILLEEKIGNSVFKNSLSYRKKVAKEMDSLMETTVPHEGSTET